MAARYSCILCGFGIEERSSSELEKWASEYRTVYRNSGSAFVSGVGLYDGYPTWRVPTDPLLRYDEVANEEGLLEVPVMQAPAVGDLHGFLLHDACWDLLQQMPGAAGLSLDRLLHVCKSLPLPIWFNGVCWGHDYGGLLRLMPDLFYPWLESPIIASTLSRLERKVPPPRKSIQPPNEGDCCSRLPWELCEMMFVLLPTKDALTLRLTSWAFHPFFSSLAFWQSRFHPDGERGFLFEARDSEIYNDIGALMNLYCLTRKSVTTPELLNRERVWHLAQRLLPLIKPPLIGHSSCSQANDHSSRGWISLQSLVQKADSSLQGRIRDIPRYPTTTTEIHVPPGAIKIGIAVMNTGIWDYITGIRIIDADGESQFAGYLLDNSEELSNVSALHGLKVAMGPYGVRALQVIGPEHQASGWAGRIDQVPISERLVANRQITSVRVTLDGYKITALAIQVEQPDDGKAVAQAASLRHTAIWYPSPPPDNLLVNEDSFTGMDPLTTRYQPISWVHFGGDRWDRLPLVQGLLSLRAYGLHGLQFKYDDTADEMGDARPVRLGRLDESELPLFTIDGADGERICSLSVGLEQDTQNVHGLDLLRHGKPQYFADNDFGREKEEFDIRDVTVAPGMTITGLYGHYNTQWGFLNIGVISEHL
ncbi:Cyclin-like F-box [Akanthomyces lecanii RCEF 1005]|uniref:Cyclin-like F-box n=1 Tax=Akanthomyces lecanii RCEF 1005 TaxID=1081108 RepID=A0A168HD77_CORDF|nr:Cyclin-like F-box [Akanthomyces lecanii RCEF 1005]